MSQFLTYISCHLCSWRHRNYFITAAFIIKCSFYEEKMIRERTYTRDALGGISQRTLNTITHANKKKYSENVRTKKLNRIAVWCTEWYLPPDKFIVLHQGHNNILHVWFIDNTRPTMTFTFFITKKIHKNAHFLQQKWPKFANLKIKDYVRKLEI